MGADPTVARNALPKCSPAVPWIQRHTLRESETNELARLIDRVASRFASAQDSDFVRAAPLLAHELPYALRAFLLDARDTEAAGAYVISAPGLFGDVGKTPQDWWSVDALEAGARPGMILVLLASVLGDVFAWATQQAGRMVHDVMPTAGHEHEQLGSSSLSELTWHTEDAFHESRADYLGLACLRNPDAVPTSLFCNADLQLDADSMACLRQERFIIVPDNSHKPSNNPGLSNECGTFDSVLERAKGTRFVAALFGDLAAPYIRVDPDFMTAAPGDTEAARALDQFFAAVKDNLVDVVLMAEEIIFIDNYRCVHGRRPFAARYDGLDRWLKRVNVSRDFRKASVSGARVGYRVVR